MSETLLQKAKAFQVAPGKNKNDIGQEEIDLAMAWLRGEVTNQQTSMALFGKNKAHVLYYLSQYIREAYERGIITINDNL